jgi:putative oxidoreductase
MILQNENLGKLFLRIAVAVILFFHGWYKLTHGIGWIQGMLGAAGFLAYGTYLAELIAPVMIIVGFRTRLAALFIVIDMIFAFILVLSGAILSVKQMGGGWSVEIEVMLLLCSVALLFSGAGKYAVSSSKKWD